VKPHTFLALFLATLAATLARAGPATETVYPPRYEFYLSPNLDAESGDRILGSTVTGIGEGEERLENLARERGVGDAGLTALRSLRAIVWDAPIAWWFSGALHEIFGHGGRGREFDASPGFHLGSPWGGRDSFASFDVKGQSTEALLYLAAGGTEADGLGAALLERRAVEGVRLRPIDLFFLASNHLNGSDYVLRTTPNPRSRPARFFAEYSGGGDVAQYLGLLHELHGDGTGITPQGVDDRVFREYRRLRRQAYWNLLDPGTWWSLGSALRMTGRGDDSPPLPLPRIGRYRFLPLLSAEWTPSGGETSLEWVMAPIASSPLGVAGPGADAGSRSPRWLSFVARRGRGPSGAFGALGAASSEAIAIGSLALGGMAEIWRDPRNGLGGGASLRARFRHGFLRRFYLDLGVKSQGYWVGQPATPGPYGGFGILYTD